MKYSNNFITKEINGTIYSAYKLRAVDVSKRGFSVLKAISPSIASGAEAIMGIADEHSDGLETDSISEMLFILKESFSDELFEEIQDDLMGSIVGDSDKTLGSGWSDYFDDHLEDYLDVLLWLCEENFYSFFIRSSLAKRLKSVVVNMPLMKKSREQETPTNTNT